MIRRNFGNIGIFFFIGWLIGIFLLIQQDNEIDRLNDDLNLFEDEYLQLWDAFEECDSVYLVQQDWIERLEKNREWHKNKYK